MNSKAEAHLTKARDYVARGEEFYRKAAEEIVAAQNEGATQVECAERIGKSQAWVSDTLKWYLNSYQSTRGDRKNAPTPYAEESGAVAKRHARSVLRTAEPEELREIMETLPAERRAAVVRAAVPPPERTTSSRSGTSFIDLLVRINSSLIELEALVASWQNPAAVPAEFSRESFNDIVQKALRIQDRFDELVAAIDNEDEDEFQKIVRNFRVTSDVR